LYLGLKDVYEGSEYPSWYKAAGYAAERADPAFCFPSLLRRSNAYTRSAINRTPPIDALTPIPALAPAESVSDEAAGFTTSEVWAAVFEVGGSPAVIELALLVSEGDFVMQTIFAISATGADKGENRERSVDFHCTTTAFCTIRRPSVNIDNAPLLFSVAGFIGAERWCGNSEFVV
jgi:hypothetical protein